MIDEEDLRRPTPRVRLRLMKSPVVGSTESQDDIVEHEVAGIDQWHKPATLGAAGFATFRGEHKGLPLFRKVGLTLQQFPWVELTCGNIVRGCQSTGAIH
jgi:hypothetical protein